MRKMLSAQEIIAKHIDSDKIIESLAKSSDYKTSNREVDKLQKLYKRMKGNVNLAEQVYRVLLKHENDITRFHAAGECNGLGIYIKESKQVLEELSARTDIENLYLKTGLKMCASDICDDAL